jgi:hypothetical protein
LLLLLYEYVSQNQSVFRPSSICPLASRTARPGSLCELIYRRDHRTTCKRAARQQSVGRYISFKRCLRHGYIDADKVSQRCTAEMTRAFGRRL